MNTLVHTSSRALVNAERIARVAAAGRVTRARIVAEHRAAEHHAQVLASATEWVEDIRALGAVEVGFKVCLSEGGKWRTVRALADAAEFLAWNVSREDDVEAWGIDAQRENVVNGGW